VRTTFFGILALALLLTLPVAAHHGAASFDTERELTLKGTVTEWIWANPHCFLKFDVADGGETKNWVVEVSNPTDMVRRGWARTSFKVGDQVSVTLQPVKSGAPVGRLRSAVLPTGTTLSNMGAPPAATAPVPTPAP